MKLERFTTYRKKDSGTSSSEEESEDSSNFDEGEQSNKKDVTFEDTRLVNEKTKQLVTGILQVIIEEQDYETVTKRVVFFVNIKIQFIIENVTNNVV